MARPVGRPTKFTAKTRELIYKSLARGGTQAIVAKRARINPSTMLAWLATGIELNRMLENNEIKEADLTDIEKEYIEFSERYYEDETEYLLGLIEGTKKEDNKWLLTRRMRQEFGDESTINLNAKVETTLSWQDMVKAAQEEK